MEKEVKWLFVVVLTVVVFSSWSMNKRISKVEREGRGADNYYIADLSGNYTTASKVVVTPFIKVNTNPKGGK